VAQPLRRHAAPQIHPFPWEGEGHGSTRSILDSPGDMEALRHRPILSGDPGSGQCRPWWTCGEI